MTERWTDETLDRFASTVATLIQANSEAIAANGKTVAANSRAIAANSAAIASSNGRMTRMESVMKLSQTQLRMMQELAEYRRSMTEMRADFREMVITQTQILQRIDENSAEIRGLQTENRRILGSHVWGTVKLTPLPRCYSL